MTKKTSTPTKPPPAAGRRPAWYSSDRDDRDAAQALDVGAEVGLVVVRRHTSRPLLVTDRRPGPLTGN